MLPFRKMFSPSCYLLILHVCQLWLSGSEEVATCSLLEWLISGLNGNDDTHSINLALSHMQEQLQYLLHLYIQDSSFGLRVGR